MMQKSEIPKVDGADGAHPPRGFRLAARLKRGASVTENVTSRANPLKSLASKRFSNPLRTKKGRESYERKGNSKVVSEKLAAKAARSSFPT